MIEKNLNDCIRFKQLQTKQQQTDAPIGHWKECIQVQEKMKKKKNNKKSGIHGMLENDTQYLKWIKMGIIMGKG